jgi:serine protease Do
VKLSVHRGGSPTEIAVTLGTFPDETTDAERPESGKPQLGMTLRDLSPSLTERLDLPRGTRGALVSEVEPGTAAERAGIRRGDVIVSVNGRLVSTVDELEETIEASRATGVARLRIQNAQGFRVIALKLR